MERLTFAGIEQKTHPRCKSYLQGVFYNREIIDMNDENIIQDIINAYIQYTSKTVVASGEWTWIQANKQRDYKRLLEEKDKVALVQLFRNLFRNQISFGISAPDTEGEADKEKFVNDTLLDIDTWREFCGDLPITELETPNIGNPFGTVIDGSLVMYNSCRHYYHAQKLNSLMELSTRQVLFEIGAGYGGVFYFLKQKRDNFCYIVCDLMETLLINYYY